MEEAVLPSVIAGMAVPKLPVVFKVVNGSLENVLRGCPSFDAQDIEGISEFRRYH